MRWMLVVLVLSAIAPSTFAEDPCEWLRHVSKPQPIFIPWEPEDALELQVTRVDRSQTTGKSQKPVVAPRGNYTYSLSEEKYSLIQVSGEGKSILRFSVPDYLHRPLTARWINAKLLLLEVSLNPRASFYWIFDVESESVIVAESEHDGTEAWNQCQTGTRTPD